MLKRRLFTLIITSAFTLVAICSGCAKNGDDNNSDDDDNASGEWHVYTVDSEGDAGKYPSIVVDSKDNVHICYYHFGVIGDSGGKDDYFKTKQPPYIMKYARKDETGWQTFDLDFLEVHGEDSGIAVDSEDNVHISYCGAGYLDGGEYHNAVFHATNPSGNWQVEMVENNVGLDYDTSVAIDSNDKVHMSYHANSTLHYATNKSGSWEVFTIDATNEDVGGHPSTVIDSNDNVHISYWSSSDRDLKYATNKSGEWKYFTIDTTASTGFYTSIAIDSDDYVHISYFNNSTDDLMYATNRPQK